MTFPDPLPTLLAPFLAAPATAAILTDFDGTLAPIVDRPGDACPLPGAVRLVGALAAAFGVVGVVSGRPVAFLQQQFDGVAGITLAGLYGMERAVGGVVADHPDAAVWRPVIALVADEAERQAPAGVGVERKGLSVALHARNAPEHADWTRAFAEQRAASTGLLVVPARMAVKLRPPIEVHKGTVTSELTHGRRAAMFLGDDRGDLEAFDALDIRRAEGMHVMKVGVRSAEAPPELLDHADVVVDGPEGVVALLRRLLPSR